MKKYSEFVSDFIGDYSDLAMVSGMFSKNKNTRARYDKETVRRNAQPRNELCNCGSGKKFKKCCGK